MSEENERLVRDFYASWTRGDPEQIAGYFADDGAYEDRSAPLDARSRAEVQAFFERAFKSMGPGSQFQFQMCNMASKGNLVFTERYDQIRAAAGSFEYPVASVFEIERGKVRRARECWDRRTALRLAPGVEPVSRPIPPRHVDTGPIAADPSAVVLGFMNANSRLDVEAMVACFAADGFYEDRPSGFHPRGHRHLRALFEGFRSVLSDFLGTDSAIKPVNWASNGNLVFVERIDEFDSPWGHVAAPVLSVAEIEDGKITYMREYWDKATSGLPEDPRQRPE